MSMITKNQRKRSAVITGGGLAVISRLASQRRATAYSGQQCRRRRSWTSEKRRMGR